MGIKYGISALELHESRMIDPEIALCASGHAGRPGIPAEKPGIPLPVVKQRGRNSLVAKTVALDEIEEALRRHPPDIAVNIHGFSECKISAVDWWVALLQEARVRYLMVVPNALGTGGRQLLTNDGADIQKIVQAHGYELIVREPEYLDPVVQKYAINPTHHYLFQL